MVSAPPRRVDVAHRNGLDHVPVIAAQQDLEHLVLALLVMAIEHRVRVRHGVARHHLPGQHLLWSIQYGVVLECGARVGQVRGGHHAEPSLRPESDTREIEHGFEGSDAGLGLSLDGLSLAAPERLVHGRSLGRVARE